MDEKNVTVSDKDDENVSPTLLKRGNILSWDEKQLIEYIRKHPEEKEELIELLKK